MSRRSGRIWSRFELRDIPPLECDRSRPWARAIGLSPGRSSIFRSRLPTSPSVAPGRIEKDDPVDRLTAPTCRWNRMPCLIGKYFWTRFDAEQRCRVLGGRVDAGWVASRYRRCVRLSRRYASVIVGGCHILRALGGSYASLAGCDAAPLPPSPAHSFGAISDDQIRLRSAESM